MASYHGIKTRAHKKRKYNIGREPAETTIGKPKMKSVRTKGCGRKNRLTATETANIILDGKNIKCRITGLEENPANKDYTRRKIITKGAVLTVETPDGKEVKVRVTSRPGQAGVINARAV